MKLRRTSVRRAAILWLAPLVLVVAGCSDSLPSTPALTSSALRASVTSEVFDLIDDRGEFPLEVLAGGQPMGLSAQEAKYLAVAFWDTHESFVRGYAEQDRGSPVASSGLRACPRVYLAESAYEPLTADVPEQLRRSLGDQWLVGLCAGNEQQVLIAISVSATNVTVESGRLGAVMRGARSGDFSVMGVPSGVVVPLSPEGVVVSAAAQTGRRVASPPRLVRRAMPMSPMTALWSLDLDADVRIRRPGSPSQLSVRTLLFGALDGWSRVAGGVSVEASDAGSRSLEFPVGTASAGMRAAQVRLREGAPARIEPFTVEH